MTKSRTAPTQASVLPTPQFTREEVAKGAAFARDHAAVVAWARAATLEQLERAESRAAGLAMSAFLYTGRLDDDYALLSALGRRMNGAARARRYAAATAARDAEYRAAQAEEGRLYVRGQ